MKNKPLSNYKKRKLIESFCDELTATQAAHRLNLDRNTVNKYFRRIRECIAAYREYQKMRLVVSAIKFPSQKTEIISKAFPSSYLDNQSFTVHIMHIGGQLLTEIDGHRKHDAPAFMLNMGEYFNEPFENEADPTYVQRNGELNQIADEFHVFANHRFKKYFGIKSDFTYLYVKEAEFVFNERDARRREKVLSKMIEKIFH